MFDITCPHCGEPWDNDELHGSEHYDYADAFKLFVKYGCGAMDAVWTDDTPVKCNNDPIYPAEMLENYRALNNDAGAEYAEELSSNWELVEMHGNGELPF